jgi:hypothetical protein
MKKFITLTIGLSFLGATFMITTSEASREAYQSYLYKKIKSSNRYRNFAETKGNRKQIISTKKIIRRKSVNMYAQRYNRNLLFPAKGKRNLYSSFSNKNLRKRSISNRFIGKSVKTRNSHRMSIPTANSLNPANFLFKNYFNNTFSIQVPTSSILNHKNNELTGTIPLSSIKFTVKKLENNCKDIKLFSICARSISNTFDKNNDLFRVSKTVQQYQKTDSILGSMKLNKNKYVEGFIGVKEGKYSFIARYLVEGNNGDIFLIEGSSDLNELNETVIISTQLFETFRARYQE